MTNLRAFAPNTPKHRSRPLQPASNLPPLREDLRRITWVGLAIAALFFVIGGGWVATAPLSAAVIAAGYVSPEGHRHTVQHLEGGIIREIRVEEGDRVAEGDVLLVLEDVSARAEAGALMSRLRTLAATEARLMAERENGRAVAFSHASLADETDAEVGAAIAHQTSLFETRKASVKSQQSILGQRVAQLKQQIAGAMKQLDSVRRRQALIREEIDAVDVLFKKGYERKPRLLELKRAEAKLMGKEGELVADIARTQEAIGETELRRINLKLVHLEKIAADLALVQEQRIEVEKEIKASLDRLRRTEIFAPVAGTVLALKFHSIGGVIRPGQAILDIVPSEDGLVIEARVSPIDIDDIRTGLAAYVTFPSYAQRHLLRIAGKVTHVSADALEDERSGEPYFLTKIQVDRTHLQERAPEIELTPGLPAESYIATADRTVLEYLIQPFTQALERAFREN